MLESSISLKASFVIELITVGYMTITTKLDANVVQSLSNKEVTILELRCLRNKERFRKAFVHKYFLIRLKGF